MKTKRFHGWWFHSLALAGMLFAVASGLYAHHSEVVYDNSRTIELKGTVTEFRLTNPHASIHFTVGTAEGVQEAWIAEMGPVGTLVRAGWDKTTIKAGDEIEMVSYPHKDGLHRIRFLSLVVNGKVLRERNE